MDKLSEYQGVAGRFHVIRDEFREKVKTWKEEASAIDIKSVLSHQPAPQQQKEESKPEDYEHIFRKKNWGELVRVSAAVMGIEFSYAAETAFVSPTLLEIGIDHTRMTMVWALSPLVGFFLTPVLGSLSDKCNLKFGRRRPFILLLSVGILLGLLLVPNGKDLGKQLGDIYRDRSFNASSNNETLTDPTADHPWGVVFTILGTVLLDFDADACQSPSRAYLLDVTVPEDHARGLSTFTIMAGLGGFIGYAMGGFNWDITIIGKLLGGHVKAAFTLITVIFILCVIFTITSFAEIPLYVLNERMNLTTKTKNCNEETPIPKENENYGTVSNSTKIQEQDTSFTNEIKTEDIVTEVPNKENGTPHQVTTPQSPESFQVDTQPPSLKEYLLSIVYMPNSLRILCVTNLFCWMAHVCYSLNFTDYVGEAVFGGNPKAPEGSLEFLLYQEGVRFGCWGMSMYSLSCACYSLIIERLIKKFRAKLVYVGGTAFFGFGMILMAILQNKVAVIIFSWTAGVMYSTLFTMPYLLVAHYHSTNKFENSENASKHVRGLGTDIALVGSMVFLAQFILSLIIGSVVSLAGTTTVYVLASAILSICGSISATQVLYLDL
ncbi:loss of visual transmission isoform X2 [Rhodnius prolixus]|uniref:loss of visual transmission isoform X2 n=1 Tax=Rhodnius prolixus TaxID=13249 RepID=UPI003D18CE7D